jgi:hypothetical protein
VLGKGRAALTSGIVLHLIISLGYIITAVVANSAQHRSAFGVALEGVSPAFASILTNDGVDIQIMLLAIIVTAVLLAIMPVVSLILSGVAPVGHYLRETYLRRHGIHGP